MPWAVRETEFEKYSGVFYPRRTLSAWSRKLFEQGIMTKGNIGSYWKTLVNSKDEKTRESVTFEEAREYFDRRSELLEETTLRLIHEDHTLSYAAARSAAWDDVYRSLWLEYHCCYFSCKTFHFSAWNEQGCLAEVYELTREISRKEDAHGKLC